MKILVTGGAGFIGLHLTRRLVEMGHEVLAIGRKDGSIGPIPPGVLYTRADFADPGSYQSILDGVKRVYHLAWTTFPAGAEADWAHDTLENVTGSVNLFKSLVRRRVEEIVFASSGGMVYGSPLVFPTSEDHPTRPIAAHGVAKLCVEHYAHFLAHQGLVRTTILRMGNVYGRFQDPNKGLGFVSTAVRCAIEGVPLTIWGDGSIVRDYLHVDDVTSAMADLPDRTTRCTTYNIATGIGASQTEIVEKVRAISGRPLTVRHQPHRPFDTHKSVLAIDRAVASGWMPRIPLDEGIDRLCGAD